MLESVDTLQIEQEVNLLEAVMDTIGFGCCEQPNKYYIFDGKKPAEEQKPGAAAHLFTIQESPTDDCQSMCCRVCFNPFHSMHLTVVTAGAAPEKVFDIDRPFRCCGCACFCCACCLQEWNAVSSTNEILGSIRQPVCGGGCCPKFNIFDGAPDENNSYGDQQPSMWIAGPHFIGELCCDVTFNLMKNGTTPEGTPGPEVVGTITKLGAKGGMDAVKELLTDADKFEMTIPQGETVTTKATAITGMVLLDYYFFENGGAFTCDPFAGPGEEYCRLNICTEYYCGTLVPWSISCSKGEGG